MHAKATWAAAHLVAALLIVTGTIGGGLFSAPRATAAPAASATLTAPSTVEAGTTFTVSLALTGAIATGPAVLRSGASILGTEPVDANGAATFAAVPAGSAGTLSLTSTIPTAEGDIVADTISVTVTSAARLLTMNGPASATAGAPVRLNVTVTDLAGGGVPGERVDVTGAGTLLSGTTDTDGRVTITFTPASAGTLTLRAVATSTQALSNPLSVKVLPESTRLTLAAPALTSEKPAQATVRLTDSAGVGLAGEQILISWRAGLGATRTVGVRTGPTGTASFTIVGWKTVAVSAKHAANGRWASASATLNVTARPSGAVIRTPAGLPAPKIEYPDRPQAIGLGANVTITAIPDTVWKRMQGVSWTPGCLARSKLRYVTLNHWGFDGYRHRGEIVLSASAAASYGKVFSDLYALRYPIRQMRLVDDFGRGPWKGANDYASMAAGNTSGFNCRYVVGRERSRVISPHSWGRSVDMNPWENPYVTGRGTFPNRAWLPRSIKHPAVLSNRSNPAVRAFIRQGFSWGGSYADYHHFQP